LRTFIGKNDSSAIIDSNLGRGQPQTSHITAKITNIKDLSLIS